MRDSEFFIDNLLARNHFIIERIWWTGLAPWKIELYRPGSRISTLLKTSQLSRVQGVNYRGETDAAEPRLGHLGAARRLPRRYARLTNYLGFRV